MAEKRNNQYNIQIQEVALKDGSEPSKSLELTIQNHDNIFDLIDRVKESELFEQKSDNVEMLLGIKLFSEVMLRNRTNPLFSEFAPAFREFMKKYKSSNQTANSTASS